MEWLSDVARKMYECPKCKAVIDQYCMTPSGAPAKGLTGGCHGVRMALVPPAVAKERCTVNIMSFEDIISQHLEKMS